jgi:hypothetical protein
MFLKGKISPLPTVGNVRQMWRMAKVARRIDESRTLKSMPIQGEGAGSGFAAGSSSPAGPGGAS